jgi:hypothetical protein
MTWPPKFLTYLYVFENFSCYVYNSSLIERSEKDFKPATEDFTLKSVSNEQQMDDLIKGGFNFLSHLAKAKYRISKGAAACFIFVGKELASMEWVAMNPEAKAAIDIYPCKVLYEAKEAYAGGVWTNPRYRGKGLHVYVYYRIYDFLREHGIKSVKSIVEVNNTAALKAHARFAPEEKIEAKAHYLRILGLHLWRETPYKPPRGN